MFVPTDDGQWVSEKFAHLAEIIQDYDPSLELCWIPPDKRKRGDKPYCVVHNHPNGKRYVVMYAGELDSPESVLASLWAGDSNKHDVLKFLDAQDAAREAFKLKQRMDIQEAQRDFAKFLIKTPKNFINTTNPITGERLKLDDQLRKRDGNQNRNKRRRSRQKDFRR